LITLSVVEGDKIFVLEFHCELFNYIPAQLLVFENNWMEQVASIRLPVARCAACRTQLPSRLHRRRWHHSRVPSGEWRERESCGNLERVAQAETKFVPSHLSGRDALLMCRVSANFCDCGVTQLTSSHAF
jgi:hypothetical protein